MGKKDTCERDLNSSVLSEMWCVRFGSVQLLSRVRLFATPWTTARQASLSLTNSWSLHNPMSIESVMPSNHLILCRPLLLLPPSPPSIRVFSTSQLFTSGGQSIGVSALAWILPMNIQDWFPLRLVWSPCSPRDSQESSPTSQFKSINFLVPSFLYSPVLIILFLFLWLILQHQKCRQGLSIVMKKLAPGIHSN